MPRLRGTTLYLDIVGLLCVLHNCWFEFGFTCTVFALSNHEVVFQIPIIIIETYEIYLQIISQKIPITLYCFINVLKRLRSETLKFIKLKSQSIQISRLKKILINQKIDNSRFFACIYLFFEKERFFDKFSRYSYNQSVQQF